MSMKNHNIQVLRGIAILYVLIRHIPILLSDAEAGWYESSVLTLINPDTGVDLFFVISGYLMGVTFLSKTYNGNSFLQSCQFYQKRFYRLLPACYFWSIVILIAGFISADLWLNEYQLLKKTIANLFFIRNFEEYKNATHLGYFWSISVEAQFYLLLPIAWFLLPQKYFWGLICALLVLGIFWRPGGENFWMLRYDGLLIGLLVWKLTTIDNYQEALRCILPVKKYSFHFSIFIFMVLLITVKHIFYTNLYFAYFIAAAISGLLVISALFSPYKILGPCSNVVAELGMISYSVYLCHIPVWILTKKFFAFYAIENPFIIKFTGFLLVFIVAYLSYKFIEPILTNRLKKNPQLAI
jgi:peptidoglycan/LPS O-acetylase OafA/YrhL